MSLSNLWVLWNWEGYIHATHIPSAVQVLIIRHLPYHNYSPDLNGGLGLVVHKMAMMRLTPPIFFYFPRQQSR